MRGPRSSGATVAALGIPMLATGRGMGAPSLLGGNANIAFYSVGISPGQKFPAGLFVLKVRSGAPVFFRAYFGAWRLAGTTRH